MSDIVLPEESSSNDDWRSFARLGRQVAAKREEIDTYLAAIRARRDRLVNVTMVGGSIAAALTAGPAFGGKPFSLWLEEDVGLIAPAWRFLCLAAMICSLAATIATQLNRARNYDTNIARAQEAWAALEALEVGIASGYLNKEEATSRYLKCLEVASVIDMREAQRSAFRGVRNRLKQRSES